jgi:hypothetical protein
LNLSGAIFAGYTQCCRYRIDEAILKMGNRSLFAIFLLISLVIFSSPYPGEAARPYTPYPGVIHLHSRFSSGDHSIEELAQMARERGLKYLVITDHDLAVMEYGLFPFRNLLKRRERRPSIIEAGPRRYLQTIAAIDRAVKEVVVIPGAQSSPYYYWTGNPLRGNLTAHDYRKEILVVGIKDPDFFSAIPVLHHGPSTTLLTSLLPEVLFPLGALILSGLLFQRQRSLGIIALIFSLLFLVNARPLRTSRFTPYDGDRGMAPYQDLMDYAGKTNVLTFWAHPESNFSTEGKKLGPVTLRTKKYVGDLLKARGYTGFPAIYGDTSTMENPGREWDRLLQEYCSGSRQQAVWAIAGADFHGASRSDPLDTYVTVLWSKRLDSSDMLEALQKGRCYAIRQKEGRGLRLDRFQLQTREGKVAWAGETLLTSGAPLLTIEVSLSDLRSSPVKMRIIRNGLVWHEVEGLTPLSLSKRDDGLGKGMSYYRIEVTGRPSLRLISNPIFVEKI